MEWIVAGLVAVIVIGLVVARYMKRMPIHTVGEVVGHKVTFGPELGAFVHAYATAADRDDPAYVKALRTLRERAAAVVTEAEKIEGSVPAHDYATRQALVFAIAEAADPAGIPFLRRIATHNIATDATHQMSGPAVQETGLSLTAIDGLATLAGAGHADAATALVEAAATSSLAVRALALTALRESGRTQTQFDAAVAMLPQELRHLAGLRQVSVRDVPQIADPRLHLRRPEQRLQQPPSLDGLTQGDVPVRGSGRWPAPRAGRRV